MIRVGPIALTAALFFSLDFPPILHLKPPSNSHVEIPASDNLPPLPDMVSPEPQAKPDQNGAAAAKSKNEKLRPESEFALVRFVDGEFARVVAPVPGGKKGFHWKAGEPLDQTALHNAIAISGAAANPGDTVQITKLEFKDRSIIVDINGGGKGRTNWRNHISLDVGAVGPMTPTVNTTATANDPNAPINNPKVGATIYLEFDKPLPDMTPDELKEFLSGMLDFSKQRSAAVQWLDTLPPDIKKAVQEKRAAVGMDHDTVLAAMGRPDHKVRERKPDGTETEDWIYGKPPEKTVFVTFIGDKVTRVESFPN